MEINYNGVQIDLDKVAAAVSGKSAQAKPDKTIQRNFTEIDALDLKGLTAKVTIRPGATDRALVEVTGPEDAVEAVKMTTRSQDRYTTLTINQDRTASKTISFGNSVVLGGNEGIRICGNMVTSSVIIQDNGRGSMSIVSGASPQITINITLPAGANISVDDCCGAVEIGAFRGNLYTYISGSTKVHAQAVRGIKATISGSGEVAINQLNGGEAKLQISGSGSIKIQDGRASELDANVSGSGNIWANVIAQDADLCVSGVGEIVVKCVQGRLSKHKGRLGNITVHDHF